jgi:hypothetical protein
MSVCAGCLCAGRYRRVVAPRGIERGNVQREEDRLRTEACKVLLQQTNIRADVSVCRLPVRGQIIAR